MNLTNDREMNDQETIERLRIALADAINRPLGVIPDSALGLITAMELEEAARRRAVQTSQTDE